MKTARLASAIASINGWIAFAVTIFIVFSLDKHWLLPFIFRCFDDYSMFVGFLCVCLMEIVYVLVAVIAEIVGSLIQFPIGASIMYFDEEIRQEADDAGLSYKDMCTDTFVRSMKEQLILSLARVLSFWQEAPMATIVHFACAFAILKLHW